MDIQLFVQNEHSPRHKLTRNLIRFEESSSQFHLYAGPADVAVIPNEPPLSMTFGAEVHLVFASEAAVDQFRSAFESAVQLEQSITSSMLD